jgi:hypothetical protein
MEESTPEQKVIEAILPEDCQGFLIDYFMNGLLGENKVFTKGLTAQDYDIILSTVDAEDSDIFHSLNICNTKFDRETCPSRKVITFEDLEAVIEPFLNGKELAEKFFKEVTIHVYPKIRRNLRADITSLNYKIVKEEEGGKLVIKDYVMEHKNDNPDNKDILCICTFKMIKGDKKTHKYDKILQLLEQFSEFPEFFDYHRIAYIIFMVEDEETILKGYPKFPAEMKKCNELYHNVRLIFYLNPSGEDDKETLNIYGFNDYGKNYYFHMNSNHEIYRADDMLCSGDIIENSIKRKKKEKEENEKNKALNKTKEQLMNEKNEAFFTFYNFLKNIKDYKYALYMSFKFDICLRYNEEFALTVNYIDFSHIIAELRTKEYNIIKKCAEKLNPDLLELEEIPTLDIEIDFTNNECYRCGRMIQDNEPMYYCYKDKIKYCRKCVITNFQCNRGKAKFIDPKHNILYFKTRDKEKFKNIDRHKLGNDLFANCTEDGKLVDHAASCNGCKQGFRDSPRYLCLNCRPGKLHADGYFDYCDDCVEHMMKGDEKGIEMQKLEDRLYSDETRLLYEAKETFRHENDNHVYLMIALQYNCNDEPYYAF